MTPLEPLKVFGPPLPPNFKVIGGKSVETPYATYLLEEARKILGPELSAQIKPQEVGGRTYTIISEHNHDDPRYQELTKFLADQAAKGKLELYDEEAPRSPGAQDREIAKLDGLDQLNHMLGLEDPVVKYLYHFSLNYQFYPHLDEVRKIDPERERQSFFLFRINMRHVMLLREIWHKALPRLKKLGLEQRVQRFNAIWLDFTKSYATLRQLHRNRVEHDDVTYMSPLIKAWLEEANEQIKHYPKVQEIVRENLKQNVAEYGNEALKRQREFADERTKIMARNFCSDWNGSKPTWLSMGALHEGPFVKLVKEHFQTCDKGDEKQDNKIYKFDISGVPR